jgi:ribosomal-protein-alanine N-acetyltransferase
MKIRPFRLSDLKPISRLEREAFGPHSFDTLSLLSYGIFSRGGFLVAEEDGQVAAHCITKRTGRNSWEIASIAVRLEYRRRGIGTALLTEAFQLFRSRGGREATLEVKVDNRDAQRLYERFGFSVKERLHGYYGPRHDGFLMVADLSESQTPKSPP